MDRATTSARPATRAGAIVRVVLVEDHQLVREHLVATLTDAGIEVVAACSGAGEGRTAVARWRPDVVVVDNRLPDGRGIELCGALRAEDPVLPLIVYSGAITAAEHAEAAAVGVTAMVPKSLRGTELLDTIREHAGPGGW